MHVGKKLAGPRQIARPKYLGTYVHRYIPPNVIGITNVCTCSNVHIPLVYTPQMYLSREACA